MLLFIGVVYLIELKLLKVEMTCFKFYNPLVVFPPMVDSKFPFPNGIQMDS
jgi:hypothetical protein